MSVSYRFCTTCVTYSNVLSVYMYLVIDCLFAFLGYVAGCFGLQSGVNGDLTSNISMGMTYDKDSQEWCGEIAVEVVTSAIGFASSVMSIFLVNLGRSVI